MSYDSLTNRGDYLSPHYLAEVLPREYGDGARTGADSTKPSTGPYTSPSHRANGRRDRILSAVYRRPAEARLAGPVSAGHNGIETRMGVFYSGSVAQRRVPVSRFVELTAERPAKIFGLFPRKGVIAPGSDADIVLIDPQADHVIRQAELHSQCDYSVWDGWACPGYPVTTMLRGQVLLEDGVWVGQEGTGEFVPSRRPSDP